MICKKCNVDKPITEFYSKRQVCKSCIIKHNYINHLKTWDKKRALKYEDNELHRMKIEIAEPLKIILGDMLDNGYNPFNKQELDKIEAIKLRRLEQNGKEN
jgi:hypothetical protein